MYKNIKQHIIILSLVCTINSIVAPLAYAGPQSTTYEIKEYDFGSGGTMNNNSTSYSLFGDTGQISSNGINSSNYTNLPGLSYTFSANTPAAPTFTNPGNYSNKLHIVLDTGSNPTDTKFAIAISPDNFTSTTDYVQADNTINTTPVWQTNTVWGASGFDIIGLSFATTYTVKVSAMQGSFTQSPWSATAQAATASQTLSFNLSTNSLTLNQINPSSVVTSSSVTVTVSTNGSGGATIYGYDTNGGLTSSSTGGTISSTTGDLGATNGYGLRATSVTQTSGGPMESLSPYNGANDNVGSLTTSKASIFDSTSAAVTSGQGTFVLKAKASATTKAASDYADIVTIITAATF